MKVCFLGLGSIGRRHLQNLSDVCKRESIPLEVHALRSGMGQGALSPELARLVERQCETADELDAHYDAIFLTNPTALHYDSLKRYGKLADNYFLEKPIFDRWDADVASLELNEQATYYVAAPLRFTAVIQHMRELLRGRRVYSVRCICSSYLPDWRDGADYRKTYSAKKELGGGVKIDLIHEWDYINFLFGIPEKIKVMSGRYSDLEISSEDIAIYIAQYPDMLLELHLDYFGRKTCRSIECFTEECTITGDIAGGKISFSDRTPGLVLAEPVNDRYLREMEYFLSLCQKITVENINDVENAVKTLKLTDGILE